jgi:hypothetical protein
MRKIGVSRSDYFSSQDITSHLRNLLYPANGELAIMLGKIQQSCHPIWQYLNQPLCDPLYPSVWKPQRFLYLYRIQLLEKCLRKDITSESHYTQ